MFQIKVVEKIETYILRLVAFFQKSCRLWDNVKTYGGAREAADDNMTALIYWISKATHQRLCTPTPSPHKHRNM
jgi:hypothetical protein